MKLIDKIKAAKNPCLVLQGGGMRGSYTTGVLQVFEELGLRDAFRYVVGESAGALNGAYFLSGQGTFDDGFGIYVNHLCTKEFIDPTSIPNMLNIDYLTRVIDEYQPLDVESLMSSPSELHVCMTDLETMGRGIITNRSTHVKKALFASMAVPILWGGSFEIEGHNFIDGGISQPVGYEHALMLPDVDLFVVVLTNPEGYRYSDSRLKSLVLDSSLAASRYPAQLLKRMNGLDALYNKVLRRVENDSQYFENVEALFPSNAGRLVPMLEMRREKVMDCQRMGHQDAYFFLERDIQPKTHRLERADQRPYLPGQTDEHS